MKILAADGIAQEGIDLLAKELDFEVVVKEKISHEELLSIIGDYDALMVRSASKVTPDVIEKANKLKIIGRAGVGVDNIDLPAATAKGIIVINSPSGNTIAATEHTMAMMLSLSRHIPIANETTQKGEWNRKKYKGVELRGKTLGIIGLGRIGGNVAIRAEAFEMNVIAYDPYMNEERAKNLGVKVKTLEEVVKESDFITVHMPLTPETKGMISMKEMKTMKKGARIINCARGGIVDEADLAQAVKEGIIAGAAIDVFTSEPLAEDNPLRGVPGIILTPHLGASTVEAQIAVSVDVAEGIVAALKGEPVTTAVNMAPVSRDVMKVISPYLDLGERLGCTICSIAEDAISSLEVTYSGKITEVNTKMLSTAIIKGMLNPIMEQEVNYVNAPQFAKDRHISVVESKEDEAKHFRSLIKVTAKTKKGEVSVEGALFGDEGRIVKINKFRVDVDPHARILICPHINRPGIIGTVGTVMGEANINISGMQVGRTEIDGTNLMVLTIDNDIPSAVLNKVKAIDGIFDAKLVNFHAV